MTRMVQCVKLGKEAPGLERPVYPGELGQKIWDQVSQEAWQLWLKHQTILINENRLSPVDPKSRAILVKEMENFFFGDGSALPPEFTANPTK